MVAMEIQKGMSVEIVVDDSNVLIRLSYDNSGKMAKIRYQNVPLRIETSFLELERFFYGHGIFERLKMS
jgi:hypothetical protein